MCCRPKTSFLIEDILQQSPTKTSSTTDAPWLARPTPLYVNQVSSTRRSPEILRLPTLASAAMPSVYMNEGSNSDERLRIHGYSHHQQIYPMTDPLLNTGSYRGGYGRCWTVLPGYSLALLSRHHSHNKRKGGQVRFSADQTTTLERRFREHKYLSPEERRHLAAQLKLSDRQVKTWFQNRRAKWRRANTSSTTDGNQSDDTTSSNTVLDEDFENPQLSPINVLS